MPQEITAECQSNWHWFTVVWFWQTIGITITLIATLFVCGKLKQVIKFFREW